MTYPCLVVWRASHLDLFPTDSCATGDGLANGLQIRSSQGSTAGCAAPIIELQVGAMSFI